MAAKAIPPLFLPYVPVAEAITRLFHPHVEAVLHDLKSFKIVALYNNFSKRKAGDASLLEDEIEVDKLEDFFGPYPKSNWDGRPLKSVSITIRDAKRRAIGLLCLNFDVSQFKDLGAFLTAIAGLPAGVAAPPELFADDWREKINQFVQSFLQKKHSTMKSLSRTHKQELVVALKDEGAFRAKNAALYVGDILDISRATVYTYLKDA